MTTAHCRTCVYELGTSQLHLCLLLSYPCLLKRKRRYLKIYLCHREASVCLHVLLRDQHNHSRPAPKHKVSVCPQLNNAFQSVNRTLTCSQLLSFRRRLTMQHLVAPLTCSPLTGHGLTAQDSITCTHRHHPIDVFTKASRLC